MLIFISLAALLSSQVLFRVSGILTSLIYLKVAKAKNSIMFKFINLKNKKSIQKMVIILKIYLNNLRIMLKVFVNS